MPPPSATRAERCRYCSQLLAPGPSGWRAAAADAQEEPLVDPHLPRLWLGGHRYALLGRLARGDASDVFRARRDGRLTELVTIKVLRSEEDADLLDREQKTLGALEASDAQGAAHFTRLLPQRVDHGVARLGMNGRDGEARVAIMRWRSGFVHTFDDVLASHPSGVSAEAAVWMWKRVLELLGWVHQNGIVHGAVVPSHMLVHARDHGVVLVGWSSAVPAGRPLDAMPAAARAYYPDDAWSGAPVGPRTDLAMSARVVLRALGSEAPPPPLARLLEMHARLEPGAESDAWVVKEQLDAAAREVFGPPRFVPFAMPGWK